MKVGKVRTTKAFDRQLEKYFKYSNPKEKKIFSQKMDFFYENIFDNHLKTHKLKGGMKELWSFSISYSDRIIFEIRDGDVILHDIDDHDVYR